MIPIAVRNGCGADRSGVEANECVCVGNLTARDRQGSIAIDADVQRARLSPISARNGCGANAGCVVANGSECIGNSATVDR